MITPTERLLARTVRVSKYRPLPPREGRFDDVSNLLTWAAPRRSVGAITHYRIRIGSDTAAPLYQPPVGQTSLQLTAGITRVFISSYNQINDLESPLLPVNVTPHDPSGSLSPLPPPLVALSVVPTYVKQGSDYQVVLTFTATLPVSDPNYSHLRTIQILKTVGPNVLPDIVASLTAPFSPDGANQVTLTSQAFPLSALSGSAGFTFKGITLNEDNKTSEPAPTCSITVAPPGGPSGSTSIVGSEVPGSVYKDQNDGLHFVIQAVVTTASPTYPVVFTFWADFADGKGWKPLGVRSLAGASDTQRWGEAVANSDGTTQAGDIWVPTNPAQVNWKIAALAGRWDNLTPPDGYVQSAFTVTPAGPALSYDIINAHFVNDPSTGLPMVYSLDGVGVWYWQYYEIDWDQPGLDVNEFYWFSFITVQKGYAASGNGTVAGGVNLTRTSGAAFLASDVGNEIHIGALLRTIAAYVDADHVTLSAAISPGAVSFEVWRPAPDYEGVSDPGSAGIYVGRQFTDSGTIQGGRSIPGSTVILPGPHPPTWTFPPPKNLDGTDNLFRTFRFRIYSVSRRAENPSGSVNSVALETVAWPGLKDHADLIPAAQPASLDLSQTNRTNSFSDNSALGGGNGDPLYVRATGALQVIDDAINIAATGVTSDYIADQANIARTMATNSITYANNAVAANALVDSKIASMEIGKLIAGTVVFTGDINLARGSGKAVVTMDNSGICLYSACTASGSGVTPGTEGSPTYTAAGLTSDPYVCISATSVGVFASSTGPSVITTGTGITLWSVNGSTASPYSVLTASAWQVTNGLFKLAISASQIQFSYNTTAATATLDSTKLEFAFGSFKTTITSLKVELTNGTNSVAVTASAVTITNGILSLSKNGYNISIDVQNAIAPVTSTYTGIRVINASTLNWAGMSGEGVGVFTSSVGYAILFQDALQVYNSASAVKVRLGTVSSGSASVQLSFNGTQVLRERYTDTVSDVASIIACLQYHGICN